MSSTHLPNLSESVNGCGRRRAGCAAPAWRRRAPARSRARSLNSWDDPAAPHLAHPKSPQPSSGAPFVPPPMLVSVVTTVRNEERNLAALLDSLLVQEGQLEVSIVE